MARASPATNAASRANARAKNARDGGRAPARGTTTTRRGVRTRAVDIPEFLVQKLEATTRTHGEISERMADPSVTGDPKEFQKLSKALGELTSVVEQYARYKECMKEISEARAMAKDAAGDDEMVAMAKEEIDALTTESDALVETMTLALLPKDPLDEKNIMLEIRAGTGGDEGWYLGWGFISNVYAIRRARGMANVGRDEQPGGRRRYKEIVVEIKGDDVYSSLKWEAGVHRVQRVPATETQGRIQTSTATVAVMPEVDEVEVKIDDNDLDISTARSGGAGGQNVNKVRNRYRPDAQADRHSRVLHGRTYTNEESHSCHANSSRELFELQLEEQRKAVSDKRKSQVGSGSRSEKIRTYNWKDSRVSDHRIGANFSLQNFLDGDIKGAIGGMQALEQEEKLAELNAEMSGK